VTDGSAAKDLPLPPARPIWREIAEGCSSQPQGHRSKKIVGGAVDARPRQLHCRL